MVMILLVEIMLHFKFFINNYQKLLENAQNIDFKYFVDAANVWGVDYDSAIDESNKIRSSTGLGLDWFTPIGPFKFFICTTNNKSIITDKTETFRFNLGTTF